MTRTLPNVNIVPTRVVNKKSGEHYDVYIGRGSIWGNPFIIGKHGTRKEVIAKYRAYILTRSDLLALIPPLQGKVLGCFCKPSACHGDVLARLADGLEPMTPESPKLDSSAEKPEIEWHQETLM